MTITNHISDAHKTNRKTEKTALALIVVLLDVLSRNCAKRGHQKKKDLAKNSTSGENNVDYVSFESFPSIID